MLALHKSKVQLKWNEREARYIIALNIVWNRKATSTLLVEGPREQRDSTSPSQYSRIKENIDVRYEIDISEGELKIIILISERFASSQFLLWFKNGVK